MNVVKKQERKSTTLQRRGTLDHQNASWEQPNLQVSRRQMLNRAGMFFGASGALTALGIPAGATSEEDTEEVLPGFWHAVVSSTNHSFPSFKTFELYGEGTWIGSAQGDLTPPVSSTPTGTWKRVGRHKFRVVGRWWNYDLSSKSTGFAALDVTITVSKNGNTYHGEGAFQFFDNDGNPVGGPATFVAAAKRITFS